MDSIEIGAQQKWLDSFSETLTCEQCPNAEVLKPRINGRELAGRAEDVWVIDFAAMPLEAASLFESPFTYVEHVVKPVRDTNRDNQRRTRWWQFGRSNEELRSKTAELHRVIVTIRHSKHRFFTWLDQRYSPDTALVVVTRADDTTFGILHSRFHELWSLRLCTWLGKGNDPRYTPTTTFETFPFPDGLTPADTTQGTETLDSGAIVPIVAPEIAVQARAIAEAAHRLNSLRENWLNPPEWVECVPEVVPGYPDRIVAKPGHAADLKKRTLTNLYNQRPAWLDQAHRALDAAVAQAYGWNDYSPKMAESEILSRLLALNLERCDR